MCDLRCIVCEEWFPPGLCLRNSRFFPFIQSFLKLVSCCMCTFTTLTHMFSYARSLLSLLSFFLSFLRLVSIPTTVFGAPEPM
jgi:hypothetical protein